LSDSDQSFHQEILPIDISPLGERKKVYELRERPGNTNTQQQYIFPVSPLNASLSSGKYTSSNVLRSPSRKIEDYFPPKTAETEKQVRLGNLIM
jgi:hypothetical protein